jgi:hypothetical protein
MVGHEASKNDNTYSNQHALLTSVSLRDAFLNWLLEGHSKKYAPVVVANCLDYISEYALQKKMCAVDLWNLPEHHAFRPVHSKLLNDRLLWNTNRSMYKVFLTAGQLYLEFLKEKSHQIEVQQDTTVIADPKKKSESASSKMIIEVISTHFPNGFMIDSPIELMRFRRFAAEIFGCDIALADDELIKSISTSGTLCDGKVFLISSEVESRIKNEVDLAISGGADIVFYSSFYAKHEEWLFAGSIISEEMLKDLLYKLYPQYTHRTNHFLPKVENGTELSIINNELIRVWGSDVLLNSGQLYERLPYIPREKIKYVLEQSSDFRRSLIGAYTLVTEVVPAEKKNYTPTAVEELSHSRSRLTIKEAIIRVLKNQQHGMTVEQIYNNIISEGLYSFSAQSPQNVVRVEIDRACVNSNYSIRAPKDCFRFERNQKGEKVYFLLSTTPTLENAPSVKNNTVAEFADIVDYEEGKKGIREILNAHFLKLYGYSNIDILWSSAQNSLPMFLNDNAINSPQDLWHFLARAFKSELVLNSPHIWPKTPDYPQNSAGLLINLARQHGGIVTREQIDDFFSNIKLSALTNSFVLSNGKLLFYDNAKFILTETVNPNADRCMLIAKALDVLFSREDASFIVLRDISKEWYSRLPALSNGLQWTPLLLQELLRIRHNIGYQVILPGLKGQALDTVGAAIVPSSNSEIRTFADVVHRFSFEKYKLPVKLSSEELRLNLRGAGMLDGNELIFNLHKVLKDHRFAFSNENQTVMILER